MLERSSTLYHDGQPWRPLKTHETSIPSMLLCKLTMRSTKAIRVSLKSYASAAHVKDDSQPKKPPFEFEIKKHENLLRLKTCAIFNDLINKYKRVPPHMQALAKLMCSFKQLYLIYVSLHIHNKYLHTWCTLSSPLASLISSESS